MSGEAERLARLTERLARRVGALGAAEMRHAALLAALEITPPADLVLMLDRLQREAHGAAPAYRQTFLTFATLLAEGAVPYQLAQALYGAAKEAGLDGLTELLLQGPAEPGRSAAGERGEDRRELTLGHRKALARSPDRAVLARLLADPEPPVVAILLANPRLTEAEVVALVARRPPDPAVQRLVFASARWQARYGVRRALVLNPGTPLAIARSILPLLQRGDLRQVAEFGSLPDALRQAARQMLEAGAPIRKS